MITFNTTLSDGGVKVIRNNSHQLEVMCEPPPHSLPTKKKK